MDRRFNIRVYGIMMQDGQILVNEEVIRGQKIIKFPGGGMNFGEGTIDCLKREWQEELGISIEVTDHFYTTDFFQPSAYDNSQLMSIYYRVAGVVPNTLINNETNERTYWMSEKDISAATFSLPIDKIVGGLIQQWLHAQGTI